MQEAPNIWQGEKVRLRAWEPEDWLHQERWSHDTEADRRTFRIPFPRSREALRRLAQEHATREVQDDSVRLVIETLEGQAVGVLSTADCDSVSGNFSYGLFVEGSQRRRGFATEAVLLLLRFYFLERRYQKANVLVYDFNLESIRLHENLGFLQEARIRRAHYTDGAYHDDLRFGMTVEEFCEKHAAWLSRNTAGRE